ncbi:hypothetical protein RB625_19660 [Streptomyces californicus]|uniref:hypothetical protein n=1 Tax=Streptomyces californicus TaxID=67351 RepID=UPI00296E4FE9|nr:hypothetical protein [Streptomyces californicus]MDW4900629.1 hypothetical protein [Streptomyces californicus]
MPTSPTPANLLRAAAEKLRAASTAAAEHSGSTTWQSIRHHPGQPGSDFTTLTAGPGRPLHKGGGGRGAAPYMHAPVSEHAALMGPGAGLALAALLESAAEYYAPGPAHPTHVVHALAVARQLLGTSVAEGRLSPAAAPLAEVWTVWREDEPVYAHYTTEADARQGTIDCWQEDEPSCPDYSWRQDGPRLELVVGGEFGGVYASRHRVYGAPPAPADRAATRDRIRRAVCEAEGFAWDTDMLEPDEYGEHADAVLAVLADDAAAGAQPPTSEAHHTVGGTRYLCHTDDHYCPTPPAAPAAPEEQR